jgi:hypothetical protein
VESTQGAAENAPWPGPALSDSRFKVTVSVFNSVPDGTAQLQPGTRLEAEFPLERRPLIRWLIGAAAW